MIPHIHTLFEFISIPYENQHQTLNIKKIDRGQIRLREYSITLLQPCHMCKSDWNSKIRFRTFIFPCLHGLLCKFYIVIKVCEKCLMIWQSFFPQILWHFNARKNGLNTEVYGEIFYCYNTWRRMSPWKIWAAGRRWWWCRWRMSGTWRHTATSSPH